MTIVIVIDRHGTVEAFESFEAFKSYDFEKFEKVAFVEAPEATREAASAALQDVQVIEIDHHGEHGEKEPAVLQARSIDVDVDLVVTEPPIDADMATATSTLLGLNVPELTATVVAINDVRGPLGLYYALKRGLLPKDNEVDVGVSIVSRISAEVNKWPDNTEKAVVEMERALEIVDEEVSDPTYTAKAKEFVEEFESKLQNVNVEVVDEGNGWVILSSNDPLALQWGYMKGYKVVASYSPKLGRVTVGHSPITGEEETWEDMVRPPRTTVDLRQLFDFLNKRHREGWGGRKDIGGSPKGVHIDEEEFEEVVKLMRTWFESKLG